MSKLGMVSSFHPHSMCKRVERVTTKTGRSSCTNWYQGFGRELICYTGTSFFQTYYNSRLFLHSVRTIQSDIINFQHFLTSFAIFQSFTDLFRELNDREIENHYKMNSEKVETWHGIIISPTWHVQKSRWLRQKLDTLLVQTGQSLSEYQGFGRELICYTGTSMFFKLIWTPTYFCIQYASFKATSSIFNTF